MTHQEIYDKVVTHLRAQGGKSVAGDKCKYRVPRTGLPPLMCAVGCLIPDSAYDPAFEGLSVNDAAIRDVVPRRDVQFLYALQLIHDGNEVGEWEREFRKLALSYGLIYTEPTCPT